MERLYSLNLRVLWQGLLTEGGAFQFLCLYLMLEYVRPQSIYTQIDILPWVQIVLVATVVAGVARNEFSRRNVPSLINNLMLLFAAVVLFSSFNSFYPAVSLKSLRTFFDWLLVYFLITKLVNNEKRFFIFLFLFLLFSFKMSQHGFVSWASRGFSFTSWGVTGAPGWFQNSGEVGIQMCIFVPIGTAFLLALRKRISKVWVVIIALMPITGVGTAIASSSRGALVGLGAAGVWTSLRRPRQFLVWVLVLTGVSFVVVESMPEEFMVRFEHSGTDFTSLHRMERWRHGIEALNENPLLGIGFNAWPEYYEKNYQPEYHGTPLVHNIFVQCGSELGYSGLIVFLLLIITNFRLTRKVRKLSKGKADRFFSTISYGFDAALVGFLVSGSFVTVLYYPYFWIHCAMTTSLHTATHVKYKQG